MIEYLKADPTTLYEGDEFKFTKDDDWHVFVMAIKLNDDMIEDYAVIYDTMVQRNFMAHQTVLVRL